MSAEGATGLILKVLGGAQLGAEIALPEGVVSFGTGEDAEIQFADLSLAPLHGELRTRGARVEVRPREGSILVGSDLVLSPDGGDGWTEIAQLDKLTVGTTCFAIGAPNAKWGKILGTPAQPARAGGAERQRKRGLAAMVAVVALLAAGGLAAGLLQERARLGGILPLADGAPLERVELALSALPFEPALQLAEEEDGTVAVTGYVQNAAQRRAVQNALVASDVAVRRNVWSLEAMGTDIAGLISARGLPVAYHLDGDGVAHLSGTVMDSSQSDALVGLIETQVFGLRGVQNQIRTSDDVMAEIGALLSQLALAELVNLRWTGGFVEATGAIPNEKKDNWLGFVRAFARRFSEEIPLRSFVTLEGASTTKVVPLIIGGGEGADLNGRRLPENAFDAGVVLNSETVFASDSAAEYGPAGVPALEGVARGENAARVGAAGAEESLALLERFGGAEFAAALGQALQAPAGDGAPRAGGAGDPVQRARAGGGTIPPLAEGAPVGAGQAALPPALLNEIRRYAQENPGAVGAVLAGLSEGRITSVEQLRLATLPGGSPAATGGVVRAGGGGEGVRYLDLAEGLSLVEAARDDAMRLRVGSGGGGAPSGGGALRPGSGALEGSELIVTLPARQSHQPPGAATAMKDAGFEAAFAPLPGFPNGPVGGPAAGHVTDPARTIAPGQETGVAVSQNRLQPVGYTGHGGDALSGTNPQTGEIVTGEIVTKELAPEATRDEATGLPVYPLSMASARSPLRFANIANTLIPDLSRVPMGALSEEQARVLQDGRTLLRPLPASGWVANRSQDHCWEGAHVPTDQLPHVLLLLDSVSTRNGIRMDEIATKDRLPLLEVALNSGRVRECLRQMDLVFAENVLSSSIFLQETARNPDFVEFLFYSAPRYGMAIEGVSLAGQRYLQLADSRKLLEGSAPDVETRLVLIGDDGALLRREEGYAVTLYPETLTWRVNR